MECEASSKANLLGYLFVKILGQEAGVSMSGNGSQHVCKNKECITPEKYSCTDDPSCRDEQAGGAVAVYRGVEWKLCDKLKALGWIGKQICKFVDVKASARIGLGAVASIAVTAGRPVGGCTKCCQNGRTLHSITAGPSVLLEGKAAVTFKIWKLLELEAALAGKACGSVTGTIGNQCDGSISAKPKGHYFAALCIETMVAPGVQFRIIYNEARVCIPLGLWEKCFDFPRCWKTDTDPAIACPSGTPNPE
jgi:hypothetical protein